MAWNAWKEMNSPSPIARPPPASPVAGLFRSVFLSHFFFCLLLLLVLFFFKEFKLFLFIYLSRTEKNRTREMMSGSNKI